MVKNNKKTILLAEDDKFISKVYKEGLTDAGFDVVIATNGDEALKQMRGQKKPDLVLLDIIMYSKNGFEVLEEMKKDEKLKNIPVIVVSNLGQEIDINKAKLLGVKEYLIKSNYTMKDVIEKVTFYVENN